MCILTARVIWGIAAIVQFDPALCYLIDNQKFPSNNLNSKESHDPMVEVINRYMDSTPQDIQCQYDSDEYKISVVIDLKRIL